MIYKPARKEVLVAEICLSIAKYHSNNAKLLLIIQLHVMWVSVFYQLLSTQIFMNVTRQFPMHKLYWFILYGLGIISFEAASKLH